MAQRITMACVGLASCMLEESGNSLSHWLQISLLPGGYPVPALGPGLKMVAFITTQYWTNGACSMPISVPGAWGGAVSRRICFSLSLDAHPLQHPWWQLSFLHELPAPWPCCVWCVWVSVRLRGLCDCPSAVTVVRAVALQ